MVSSAEPSSSDYKANVGAQKAICAVAASILTAIYHILKNGIPHQDLGASYFDRRPTHVKTKRPLTQLAKLGFTVQLQPITQPA
jgi:transposase